jgi:predicted nuclease of predicted toxin-antitoxin system
MRALLDNCVPWRLADHLPAHDVSSAIDLGWAELDDGPLLDQLAGQFDVLVTVDKSTPHQQRIDHRPLAVVLMRAKSNRITDLVPLISALLATLEDVQPGEVREITL